MSSSGSILKPGQQLRNGELEIVEHIGSGGFGNVYRAVWRRKDQHQDVAVKCFHVEAMSKNQLSAMQLVHQESLLIGSLDHPGTVKIHGVDLDSSMPFIFEEYLQGRDLHNAIQTRRERAPTVHEPLFSALEICQIGIQIASAVEFMHAKGIYHGDLKPSNVCFRDSEQSEIVLVDFGHGGFFEGMVLDRQLTNGTLAYMPPERTGFVKTASNVASDLYSLGVILYECCTGQALFTAQNERDFINSLLHEIPKPLATLYPDFPEPLSDIIQKLLRKNPEDRYHSAFGLGVDLERCFLALKQGEGIRPFALGTKDKLRELNYKIPIVGRQQELGRLVAGLERSLGGHGEAFMISAPSGSGKSRIAHELMHHARMRNARVTAAKFSEFESNLPLSAIGLILMEHAEAMRAESQSRKSSWRQNILNKLGPRGSLISKRFPFFEGLLPDFPSLELLDKEEETRVFQETLAEFMVNFYLPGEGQVIFLDDLQWADWQSLGVIHELCKLSQRSLASHTLLIATFRSNEVDEQHPLHELVLRQLDPELQLALGPLTRAESDQLVEYLLDESGEQVGKLQDITFQLTSGNPFYIYEYLKAAIASGIFTMQEETRTWIFNADKAKTSGMSQGVAGLVGQRIAQLSPFTRELITTASVAGASIGFDVLADLMQNYCREQGISEADRMKRLHAAHDELIQKHLVLVNEKRFVFFHDKIRESSYQLLSEDAARTLHSRYGAVLARQVLDKAIGSKEVFETAFHIMSGYPEHDAALSRRVLYEAARVAADIFAYAKAREFLQAASQLFPDSFAHDRALLAEWIRVHELLANTLAVSDQIHAALELYTRVLEYVEDRLYRAKLFAKKAEYSQTLFRYEESMMAGVAGLKCLDESVMTRGWQAIPYLIATGPFLALYAVYFYYFGRQSRDLEGDAERIRFELLLKLEVPFYFTKPLVAIANLVRTTFALMNYKDNHYRALVMCYWGVALGPFGLNKIADRLFSNSLNYFEKQSDPIQKGFVLLVWGYLVDFMVGNFRSTHFKIKEAIRNFTPVGESFWRSISYLALLHHDYFGGESGEANITSTELIELWKRVRYNPTILACTIRNYLHEQRQDQIDFIRQLSRDAEQELRAQGYDSLDVVYACLSPGELHFLRGEYEQAEPYVREAFWIVMKRSHRVAYALYAPVLYAWCLARQKKFLRCFSVLLVCWLNQLLRVRIFLPQTLYATGEAFLGLGLRRLGRSLIEAGIKIAYHRSCPGLVADGRVLLGKLLMKKHPEQAEVYFEMARDYYAQRPWPFFEEQCDRLLATCRLQRQEKVPPSKSGSLSLPYSQRTQPLQLRQHIEAGAMLDIFLKLSSLSEKLPLLRALLDSLCSATGAESGLVLLAEADSWRSVLGKNLDPVAIERQGFASFKLDKSFLDLCIKSQSLKPSIRPPTFQRNDDLNRGSVMVVPLAFDGNVYGYCYICHSQIYELFDERSVGTVSPMATQAAITLRGIQLTEELRLQNERVLELNRTLESRVEEQTRDIRSIMEHIPLGIFEVQTEALTIHKDHSRFLERLLEAKDLEGQPALPLIFSQSDLGADEKQQIKAALESMLDESELSFEINSHLLPRAITRKKDERSSQEFELSWNPIPNGDGQISKILVTLNDVTEMRKLKADAKEKSEELQIISEILTIKPEPFASFMQSSRTFAAENIKLVQTLADGGGEALKVIFMNLHTVKGAARTLGFKAMTDCYHELEQTLIAWSSNPGAVNAAAMQDVLHSGEDILERYETLAREKLGRMQSGNQGAGMSLDEASLAFTTLRTYLKQASESSRMQLAPLIQLLQTSVFMPLAAVLADIPDQIGKMARDLQKPEPSVSIDVPSLLIDRSLKETLHHVFIHLLRNSVDHGLEGATERIAHGKNPRGLLQIHGRIEGSHVLLFVQDDGRGLNLGKLRELALRQQRIDPEHADDPKRVAQLIFASGLSTADVVTDISGRGIGMGAIQKFLQDRGGDIQLDLKASPETLDAFVPCGFIISLPLHFFSPDHPHPTPLLNAV